MFLDIIQTSLAEIALVFDKTRMTTDPPAGLAAAISCETASGEGLALLVWDTPAARGDWALERMMPAIEAGDLGDLQGHPEQARPVEVWIRSTP